MGNVQVTFYCGIYWGLITTDYKTIKSQNLLKVVERRGEEFGLSFDRSKAGYQYLINASNGGWRI